MEHIIILSLLKGNATYPNLHPQGHIQTKRKEHTPNQLITHNCCWDDGGTRVAYKSLANLSTYSGGFVSRVCLIILVSSFAFSLQQILKFFQLCTRLIIKLMFPIFPCITSAPDILPGTHCLFADMFCFHLLLKLTLISWLSIADSLKWLSILLSDTQYDPKVDILFFIMTYSTG